MDWAKHTKQKAAAKMHLDLDLKSFLPNFAIVNRAKDSDPKIAWELCAPIRAGEIVVFDKAYVDFEHLYHLHQKSVIWVTHAKENMCYEVMGQQLSEAEIQQAQHMFEEKIFVGQQPIVLNLNYCPRFSNQKRRIIFGSEGRKAKTNDYFIYDSDVYSCSGQSHTDYTKKTSCCLFDLPV